MLAAERDRAIAANRREFAAAYDGLRWVSPTEAEHAETLRAATLGALDGRLRWAFDGSKPHLGPLSPGCQACGEGTWSCLFINGRCNARCFFCPSEQAEIGEPATSTVGFPKPAEYADFVSRFAVRGVSLSGGEPLLTRKRTVAYIEAVRARLGAKAHLWVYTNGTLLDADTLCELRAAGVDELRLNLHAAGYAIAPVVQAVRVMPLVTVEIPAIPEEEGRLQALLPALRDAGLAHLNLHQLRATPFNCRHFAARGYTLLHGPKASVLESELTALRLMRHAAEAGIDLPIQYCAFAYRQRFQAAAARRRFAPVVRKSWEDLTGEGVIRTLVLKSDAARLGAVVARFEAVAIPAAAWTLDARRSRLAFRLELLPLLEPADGIVAVSYHAATLRPEVSYQHPYQTFQLESGRTLVVERRPLLAERNLAPAEVDGLRSAMGEANAPVELPPDLREFERPSPGLPDYY